MGSQENDEETTNRFPMIGQPLGPLRPGLLEVPKPREGLRRSGGERVKVSFTLLDGEALKLSGKDWTHYFRIPYTKDIRRSREVKKMSMISATASRGQKFKLKFDAEPEDCIKLWRVSCRE